ncbi:hypothetical protein Anas_08892 [Armadillidium nasatum]|uniref:Uncharacterized protein n=1 Tax=Armadillidium nasatum TaxID=96803 RepID=A0A5N5TD83_9CRUS|nr:hypothetical protein Anas_08892 [Armadillidium nasatum]
MEMNIINPGEVRNPAPLREDHVNDFEVETSTSPSIYLSHTIHQYNTFNDDTQGEPSSTGEPPYVLMEEEGQYNICPACRQQQKYYQLTTKLETTRKTIKIAASTKTTYTN